MTPRGRESGQRARRLGEGDRCPVCGGTSGVSEEDGGYRCLVCGAPRVLVDGIVQRGGSEKPALERAKALRMKRAALAVVAAILLLLGVVSLTFASVAALVFGAFGVRGLLFAVVAAVPLAMSLVAFLASRRTNGAIAEAMSGAELLVAKELIASGAARDAESLGRLMHLPPGRTEELFGRAEVERLLSPDEAAPRLRVDDDAGQSLEETAEERRNRLV